MSAAAEQPRTGLGQVKHAFWTVDRQCPVDTALVTNNRCSYRSRNRRLYRILYRGVDEPEVVSNF
jgi:hypothetical protein